MVTVPCSGWDASGKAAEPIVPVHRGRTRPSLVGFRVEVDLIVCRGRRLQLDPARPPAMRAMLHTGTPCAVWLWSSPRWTLAVRNRS